MSASVNKAIILGNLGADPEVRYAPNGSAVANLRVATNRTWRNRDTNEPVTKTEWHSIVAYDKQAEVLGQYLHKGDPVYVEGRLETNKYTDKEGITRYSTQIIVESFQLLGARREDGAGAGAGSGSAPAAREDGPPAGAPSASRPPVSLSDMDDDIPF